MMVNIVRRADGRVFSYTRNHRFTGYGPSYVTPIEMTRPVAEKWLSNATPENREAFKIVEATR